MSTRTQKAATISAIVISHRREQNLSLRQSISIRERLRSAMSDTRVPGVEGKRYKPGGKERKEEK